MPCHADLHIHSCLSPCGDEDMTPANICAMARLKGLDASALCDHNSTRNLPAMETLCSECGLVFLPGVEITTREEVHLLGYFPTVETALRFGEALRAHLPPRKNRPDFFGHQYIMDTGENILEEEDALLIGATDLPLSAAAALVRQHGGVSIPAHINRGANGMLINLGFLPDDIAFPALEIWKELPCDPSVLQGRRVLHASDAHYLGDIREREDAVVLPAEDRASLLAYLRGQPVP